MRLDGSGVGTELTVIEPAVAAVSRNPSEAHAPVEELQKLTTLLWEVSYVPTAGKAERSCPGSQTIPLPVASVHTVGKSGANGSALPPGVNVVITSGPVELNDMVAGVITPVVTSIWNVAENDSAEAPAKELTEIDT